MILTLLLAAAFMLPDIACVGFTGRDCDRTYPFNQCGLHYALIESPEAGSTINVTNGVIRINEEFCSREEAFDFIKDGVNYYNAIPLYRDLDLNHPNFTPVSLTEILSYRVQYYIRPGQRIVGGHE